MKASRRPSGDHWGQTSLPPPLVSLRCPLPSAFITQIVDLIASFRTYAIRRPSGDGVGDHSAAVAVLVRFRCPAPLLPTTKISPRGGGGAAAPASGESENGDGCE